VHAVISTAAHPPPQGLPRAVSPRPSASTSTHFLHQLPSRNGLVEGFPRHTSPLQPRKNLRLRQASRVVTDALFGRNRIVSEIPAEVKRERTTNDNGSMPDA